MCTVLANPNQFMSCPPLASVWCVCVYVCVCVPSLVHISLTLWLPFKHVSLHSCTSAQLCGCLSSMSAFTRTHQPDFVAACQACQPSLVHISPTLWLPVKHVSLHSCAGAQSQGPAGQVHGETAQAQCVQRPQTHSHPRQRMTCLYHVSCLTYAYGLCGSLACVCISIVNQCATGAKYI